MQDAIGAWAGHPVPSVEPETKRPGKEYHALWRRVREAIDDYVVERDLYYVIDRVGRGSVYRISTGAPPELTPPNLPEELKS